MKVVVFTANNARIVELQGPQLHGFLLEHPSAMVEPSLDAVAGLPPHYWKRAGNKIVPLTASEKIAVDQSHQAIGVDNAVVSPEPVPAHRGIQFRIALYSLSAYLAGALSAIILYRRLHG
jgi:hypothetical protein